MSIPLSSTPSIFSYPKYWAECYGIAKVLPRTRAEMDQLGWDSCDVILVTGDAYIDHPSFGMALIGRLLENQGFRVGIIDQPDWRNVKGFQCLGMPNLFFGVTAGNMDSMINRYTADKKIRHDDAYTPGNVAGKRPDRAVNVYAQRCREAYPEIPIILGGIEASLRRISHYDYWSDKVRRSVILDAKADLLVYGNAERQITEIAHRLAQGENIQNLTDIRGTAFIVKQQVPSDYLEINSTRVDRPGKVDVAVNPYTTAEESNQCKTTVDTIDRTVAVNQIIHRWDKNKTVIRLPSYEKVKSDPVLYAHASRVLHIETNPGNARALVQKHGNQDVWLNPPPYPLTSEEMDGVFELSYSRQPHPDYQGMRLPAYEMIRFSINIMRGCFGGCTFCSITEHEGRIIQNRSEASILQEIETIRDTVPEFKGYISDLGGPTANMYRLACRDPNIEALCRKPSCVFPDICKQLDTRHDALIQLYRKARNLPGIKAVFVSSGLRYDLALRSKEYIKELIQHHVSGYLKIAPEHTEDATLNKMMKPSISIYNEFKILFDKYSKEANKEQYLIPYFIAAHPGSTQEDMLNLALWLKRNKFRPDQVQTFYPSPMASATAMYYSGRNPLRKLHYKGERVFTAKGERERRLQKAFLRYHDPKNWPMLRTALKNMGRMDLIGTGERHLIPPASSKSMLTSVSQKKEKNTIARKRKTTRPQYQRKAVKKH